MYSNGNFACIVAVTYSSEFASLVQRTRFDRATDSLCSYNGLALLVQRTRFARTTASLRSYNGLASLVQRTRFARTTDSLPSYNGLALLVQRTRFARTTDVLARPVGRLFRLPGWALFWQFPVGEFARLPGWPCPVIARLLASSQFDLLEKHRATQRNSSAVHELQSAAKRVLSGL